MAIKADANDFDFGSIAPIKFMFVDCDLYRPTLNILRNAAPYLASDFIILVDDVMDNSRWDGAFEAFHEFASETNFSTEVIAGNCGVVRPAQPVRSVFPTTCAANLCAYPRTNRYSLFSGLWRSHAAWKP